MVSFESVWENMSEYRSVRNVFVASGSVANRENRRTRHIIILTILKVFVCGLRTTLSPCLCGV